MLLLPVKGGRMRLFKIYYKDKESKVLAATSKRKIDKKGAIYIEDITYSVAGVYDRLLELMDREGFSKNEIIFVISCLTQ